MAKNLRVLILGEDESGDDDPHVLQMEVGENGVQHTAEVEGGNLELSLCAVEGISRPRTMKLMDMVNGDKVKMRIDSGSSHNFIGAKVVQDLGLQISIADLRAVKLGDGFVKHSMGYCDMDL